MRQRGSNSALVRVAALLTGLMLTAAPAPAGTDDAFPERRPLTRSEAADLLSGSPADGFLMNSRIREAWDASRAPASDQATRRAVALLTTRPHLPAERVFLAPGGTPIRYTLADGSIDRVPAADADRDGIPDIVQKVSLGVTQARAALADRLGLAEPQGFEIVLAGLGGGSDGYLIPLESKDSSLLAIIEAAPRDGADGARRAAIRQYAHAVARTLGDPFPAGWSEALAQWTVLSIDGRPDSTTGPFLERRLERIASGLFGNDAELAAGNALWLAFLNEAYSPIALRLTLEELATGSSEAVALDRALRRATDDDLVSAYREFHVWALLTGSRADGFHFSFAPDLADPRFASTNVGLPALSVQADPPVAPWGAAHVLIRPDAADGGLRIRFEGDFAARWEADLLIVGRDGSLRRLAVELTEGRGELAVPLGNVVETVLLVRNLGSDDGIARRYTYAAYRERGYPFDLSSLDAVVDPVGQGVAVTWETSSEQELIGFNVLRVREGGGREVAVSPVWVPAIGNDSDATGYFFLDRTAEPGVAYLYRIEGITKLGLTSSTKAVGVRTAPRSR